MVSVNPGSEPPLILGVGGTGAQMLDQLLRNRGQVNGDGNRLPTELGQFIEAINLDYQFVDIAGDLLEVTQIGQQPGGWIGSVEDIDTEDVVDQGEYVNKVRVLAGLEGGATRIPPLSEFVGHHMFDGLFPDNRLASFGQMTMFLHSLGGGTGSGLAPYLAMELRRRQKGDYFVAISAVQSGGGEAAVKTNHVYNFPRVNTAFDLVLLVETNPLPQLSRQRDSILRRYREHIAADIGAPPRYLSTPNLAVTDRFAARLVRLLSLLSRRGNPGDIRTHMSSGSESKYNHSAHWAIPYVWPIDQDFEDDMEGIPPAYYAWRALAEGALCTPSERFRSATHAVILLEAPDTYLEQFPEWEDNVSRVVCELTGLDDSRVLKRAVTSEAKGLSLCILMAAQAPNFVESWEDDSQLQDDLKVAPGRWADLADQGDNQTAGNANARWDTFSDKLAEMNDAATVSSIRDQATTFRRQTIMPLELWNDYTKFAIDAGLKAE